MQRPPSFSPIRSVLCLVWYGLVLSLCAGACAAPALCEGPRKSPSIFAPASTPAHEILGLSVFVLIITGAIFVAVAGLLVFVILKFKARKGDPMHEPPQIYGSIQVELAWTVIPVLIVVVLFLTTARIIFAIQDAPKPQSALDVTVVGHQFWWEFRYPKLGIVTANELHVPVEQPSIRSPRFCACSRPTWITASGFRSWPAKPT